jgi:hypothetical protein
MMKDHVNGVIERGDSSYVSPVFFILKKQNRDATASEGRLVILDKKISLDAGDFSDCPKQYLKRTKKLVHAANTRVLSSIRILIIEHLAACAHSFARTYYPQYAIYLSNTLLHLHTALHARIIHNTRATD